MAHPTTSEASTPVSAEAVQDFIAEQFLGGADEAVAEEEEDENPEGDEPEGEQEEGEEPESDKPNDEDGEASEPIAPPVSWDKDAKEAFAQLPRELQATVAEREAQRDKAIQQATTEAANAKRNAVVEANAAFAEQQRQYASHLEQIAARLAPQAPDPVLATQDPAAYVQALARYQQEAAQHQQMVQQAKAAQQEAQQRDTLTRQHEIAQNAEALANHFGDTWNDISQRQALLTGLTSVGAELGYPMELMSEASATDIIALAKANEWKAKAEKFDQLEMNVKMEAVRAAKGKPRVNKPGVTAGNAEKSARSRDAAWAKVKESRGKDGASTVAYLESIGIKI